jgi:hypothetical protein
MAKHTIVAKGGRRLAIQSSRTSEGCIQFEIIGADKQSLGVITLDEGCAGAVAAAIESCCAFNAKGPADYLASVARPRARRDLMALPVLGEVS